MNSRLDDVENQVNNLEDRIAGKKKKTIRTESNEMRTVPGAPGTTSNVPTVTSRGHQEERRPGN